MIVCGTLEGRRGVLGRHERDERLAEVRGNVLEHEAIVRVDDDEQRAPSERIQVPWIKAVRFFLFLVFGVATAARQHATQIVTHYKQNIRYLKQIAQYAILDVLSSGCLEVEKQPSAEMYRRRAPLAGSSLKPLARKTRTWLRLGLYSKYLCGFSLRFALSPFSKYLEPNHTFIDYSNKLLTVDVS